MNDGSCETATTAGDRLADLKRVSGSWNGFVPCCVAPASRPRRAEARHPQADHQRLIHRSGGLRHHDDLAGQGGNRRGQHQLHLDVVVFEVGGDVLQHLNGDQQLKHLAEHHLQLRDQEGELSGRHLPGQHRQQLQCGSSDHHHHGHRQDLGKHTLKAQQALLEQIVVAKPILGAVHKLKPQLLKGSN